MEQDGKHAARAVWGATPAGTSHAEGSTPGTRAFFERVVARRNADELPWLSRLVPFHGMSGREVLEVGCGAGYDAYTFLVNRADYTGIDITPENVERTRSHLDLFGLEGRVMEADAEELPFGDERFDVYYSNGVLHHVPDIRQALKEAHRVLRPGGNLWIVLYHRTSVFYWLTLYLYHWWILGDRKRYVSFAQRVARIEQTTSDRLPIVKAYTRPEVEALLRQAQFSTFKTCIRKISPADLPFDHIGFVRAIPQSLLDLLATKYGWYVIAHARKTLDPDRQSTAGAP